VPHLEKRNILKTGAVWADGELPPRTAEYADAEKRIIARNAPNISNRPIGNLVGCLCPTLRALLSLLLTALVEIAIFAQDKPDRPPWATEVEGPPARTRASQHPSRQSPMIRRKVGSAVAFV